MVGHAHGHRLQSTGGFEGHAGTAAEDQRQRPWPEAFGQQAWIVRAVQEHVVLPFTAPPLTMDRSSVGNLGVEVGFPARIRGWEKVARGWFF